MFEFLRKRIFSKDIIALFIVLSVVYFKDFFLSCSNYLDASFSSQIPLTWDFTSLNNVLPYKDIYFPYGILFYFKNNIFLSLINFFLPTVLFVSVYLLFKKIFGSRLLGFVSLITFYLFIHRYTGVENFSRYGIILFFAILLSYVFYKFHSLTPRHSFFLGALIGGTFSLVNDQGIYSLALFIFLLILTPILRKTEALNYLGFLFSRLASLVSGVLVGFLPFYMFLSLNGITNDFFLFVKHLPDFTLYAKTPFIPFSTTIDNLFTYGAIFIAIIALSYKTFFLKKKLNLLSLLEISLVFVLILLEQKNIVRSIDKQITFISFLLYIVMFCELIRDKLSKVYAISLLVSISILVISGFILHPFINYRLEFKKDLISVFLNKNLSAFIWEKNRYCLGNNLNRLMNENTKFEKVKDLIKKDSKEYSKIFNYLSDPVFYVLFNQKPPYYFTIFEATPLYAQESNIQYIKENKVKYVIYNKDALAIQDGVPDQIRSRGLHKYVLDNFKILDEVENFTIYKKI